MNNSIADPTITVVYHMTPSKRDIIQSIPYKMAKKTTEDTISNIKLPPFNMPLIQPKNTPIINLAIPKSTALSSIGLSILWVAKNNSIKKILIKYPIPHLPCFHMLLISKSCFSNGIHAFVACPMPHHYSTSFYIFQVPYLTTCLHTKHFPLEIAS